MDFNPLSRKNKNSVLGDVGKYNNGNRVKWECTGWDDCRFVGPIRGTFIFNNSGGFSTISRFLERVFMDLKD